MRDITNNIKTYYQYNGKFYVVSDRKRFKMGDVFIDGRDYYFKEVSTESDLVNLSYMAPELYCILEESTIQN